MKSERIGVIGLGRMGQAIAARLAEQGFVVSGWTRSGVSEAQAAAWGISACKDIAGLVEVSDVIVLSLFDDGAVHAVLKQLLELPLEGKLIMDTSTVSPSLLPSVLEQLGQAGASAVDAPISGGPELVAQGVCGVFIGGDGAAVARAMPVAQALSDKVGHIGPLGHGLAAKVMNNMLIGVFLQGVKEALETGQRAGLSMDTMLSVITKSPAANPFLINRLPRLTGQDDTVGFSADGVLKDATLFQGVAQGLDVDVPGLTAWVDSTRAYCEAGFGAEDLAGIVRQGLKSE